MLCTRVHIEPVTEIQARLARDAYRDFGKGSGHSAKLNFADPAGIRQSRAWHSRIYDHFDVDFSGGWREQTNLEKMGFGDQIARRSK